MGTRLESLHTRGLTHVQIMIEAVSPHTHGHIQAPLTTLVYFLCINNTLHMLATCSSVAAHQSKWCAMRWVPSGVARYVYCKQK